MTLRLYDTATRSTGPLVPLRPGVVGVYDCGPALCRPPDLGRLRQAVALDVLHRWLRAGGHAVTVVRGLTDVDDAVVHDAAHGDEPWWALAARVERELTGAYDAVQVLPATATARVSGAIPGVVALVAQVLERGHGYVSAGDVYLAVRGVPGYGALSGQDPERLRASDKAVAHGHSGARRDPLDVALWRAARPGEPSWPAPWGPGRPGGHVGCSGIAAQHLGPEFDLHVGGADLLFPHHESELAASRCAGHPHARRWLHTGQVTADGGPPPAADVLGSLRPVVLRYALLAAHYRSPLEWSAQVAAEAETAYTRVETFVRNARTAGAGEPGGADEALSKASWDEFAAALDDDLGVPQALAAVHAGVRAGNALLAAGELPAVAATASAVRRMLAVLGLDPVEQWPAPAADLAPVVDALVELAVAARAEARGRRDWAQADAIRDRLAAAGVAVEDTAAGVRWRLA